MSQAITLRNVHIELARHTYHVLISLIKKKSLKSVLICHRIICQSVLSVLLHLIFLITQQSLIQSYKKFSQEWRIIIGWLFRARIGSMCPNKSKVMCKLALASVWPFKFQKAMTKIRSAKPGLGLGTQYNFILNRRSSRKRSHLTFLTIIRRESPEQEWAPATLSNVNQLSKMKERLGSIFLTTTSKKDISRGLGLLIHHYKKRLSN